MEQLPLGTTDVLHLVNRSNKVLLGYLALVFVRPLEDELGRTRGELELPGSEFRGDLRDQLTSGQADALLLGWHW